MRYQVGTALLSDDWEAHDALAEWYLTADGLNSPAEIKVYQETPMVSALDYEDQVGDALPEWYDRESFVAAIASYRPAR